MTKLTVKSASKLLVLLIVLISSTSIFMSKASASNLEDTATASIETAENALVSAYQAVLEAEQAGANVSGLLARLNVAGGYLANAHIWYELGDFDNATRFANLSYDVEEEVRNEAYELKNEAHGLWVSDLWLRMTISIVGVICVVFLGFLAWGAFKRRYHKRILGMRPKVVSDES